MPKIKYTKDCLIKEFIDISKRNIEAFDGVKEALNQINDQNILHNTKEDDRNETVKRLVESNERFYKTTTYLLLSLIFALIVLAGAEKALEFLPHL